MGARRGAAITTMAVAAALLAGASPAGALTLSPCHSQRGFGCGTLRVPLDPTGATPGSLTLRIAAQPSKAQRRKPVLIALSGGPGQGSVSAAASFAVSLRPALSRYRLVVLDQRGTGGSGALSCPQLQKLGSIVSVLPEQVSACATRLGPRRAFFTTGDSVADLEALRVALGAPKLALMGVSYGTFVAEQYARVHPDRVDRLILDSIVPANGIDPLLLDTYGATPRVLREQCAGGRCDGVTDDPVGDVAALVATLATRHVAGLASSDELANLIVAGDLNPFLQAALPGAIRAARDGDEVPLKRLRRIGDGGATKTSDLSVALNVTTGCEDVRLPYALSSPFETRPGVLDASLAAIPPAAYAPFDAAAVRRTSYVEDCLQWPGDGTALPSQAPLPDVPALLLSGGLDLRTPFEGAQKLAAELPHGTLVRVAGTGHDELDSDITGCVRRALTRFVADRAVGTPCEGRTGNQVAVRDVPPLKLASVRRASGVAGVRGRALIAALATVDDARLSDLESLYASLPERGSGLRGGSWAAAGTNGLRLDGYAYVPGLRVSGTLRSSDGYLVGRVRVRGAHAVTGTLTLTRAGAGGVLGGRAVRYRRPLARAARSSRGPLLLGAEADRLRDARRAPR